MPKFKSRISQEIPSPIAKGNPNDSYPFSRAINKWIEGEVLSYSNINSLEDIAVGLAKFLKELQDIDTTGRPLAGAHNFYRGGLLSVYNEETINALNSLENVFPKERLGDIWIRALESKWDKKPVWIHGDVAIGNILVRNGNISAVINFGILGIGDPACDYVMAWTFFDSKSREIFKRSLNCDEDTWNRAMGWAVWKALISYDINNQDSKLSIWAKRTI